MSTVLVRRCPMNAARLPWPGDGHNGFADIEVRVPADDVSELRTAISRAWNVAPECILLLDTADGTEGTSGEGVAALIAKKASAHVDPTAPIPAAGPGSMIVTARLRRGLRTTWQPRDAPDGGAAVCWGCGGTRSVEGDQSDACLELLCGHTHCGACAAQVMSEGDADCGVVHCMHCMGRTFHSGVEAQLRRGRSSAAAASVPPSSTDAENPEDTEALQHQVSQHRDRLMRAFHWLARHRHRVEKTLQQPCRYDGSDELVRMRAVRWFKTLARLDADLPDLAAARDEVIVQATRLVAGEPVPELSERASRTLRMHGDTRYREVMRYAFIPRRDQHYTVSRSATPDGDSTLPDDIHGEDKDERTALTEGSTGDDDARRCTSLPRVLENRTIVSDADAINSSSGNPAGDHDFHEATGANGGTFVLWAARYGYDAHLRFLIDMGLPVSIYGRAGVTPLHHAATRGWVACVEVLIAAGTATEPRDSRDMTPGHYAAKHGHVACLRALHAGGARFACRDMFAETEVHTAARAGCLASLKCMHELGVYLEEPNGYGSTVAHLAAASGSGECLRFLHSCGVSLSTPNENIWSTEATPVFWAVGKGDSLRTLYELGIDLHAVNTQGENIAFRAVRIGAHALREVHTTYGVELDRADKDGATPSHAAAERDVQGADLRFLHSCGADHAL